MKLFRKHVVLLLLLMLAGTTGCFPQQSPDPEPTPPEPPVVKTMDVAVYYLKNSENDIYLVREVHQVEKSEGVARAALNELIVGTPSTPGAYRVLPADTRILNIDVEQGLATVDFSGEVLGANVGANGEGIGIASIVNTLTEFPTIQRVQFTVDGQVDKGMDWWGHVGLYEQPFSRNLSTVYEPVIWVTAPVADQTISSPVKISGTARVFEATVSFHLKDADGNILAQGFTTASEGAPGRGDFEAELAFKSEAAGKGQLEIFEVSMKDGSEVHKVIIPVEWK
ncbi:hypothetical protein ASZ90_018597 [hydrocarbon metagenome]|uniref:GerMN domain-containing protein n=1 Tax=hydrocarbon metagenome TaxID=938273 RepID=A0A0W8E5U0_9ZZZZ